MARSHMRFEAQQIGMPLAQVETMEPQSLPSFYWLASFASARKVRYLAKKAEELVADSDIDPAKLLAEENETAGDFYDQLHFTDAAYADVLVTLDARFSELAAATRGAPAERGLDQRS